MSTKKRRGNLFNRLIIRAVHFEVVPSMNTSSCVLCIETFVSGWGIPSLICSDNVTNFIPSELELFNNILNCNQQVLTWTPA